ncbi:uncharacterized protein [Danio rerio]|uniref:non-specific serine/threonine protein kinase n=1 Tax=Danio rerio TaxID=7955 RepID=A0AB32T714_DANRE
MLFTVLGVIALFLRERTIKSTVSGQDESIDRQGLVTVPSVANSDGRQIGDWCEESSLHLEEQINVQTEEPSLEEPVDGQSEEPSLVEPDSVHGEDPSLVEPDSVHGEDPSLVEPDSVHSEDSASSSSSDDVSPNLFYAESSSSDDYPQEIYSAGFNCSSELTVSSYSNFFSAESGCGDDASTDFLSAESGCGDDASTDFLSAESGCGDDASTDFLSAESGCGDDPPPNVVSAKPGCSHDDPPNVVSVEPGCSHDDPPNVVSAKPGCSHDDPPNVVSAKPGCSHDDPPNVVSVEPGCSHDDPPNVVSVEPGCSHDDPPNVVSVEPGCSHDDPPNVVSAKLGCKDVGKGASCQTEGAVSPQPEEQKDKDTHIIEINSQHYEIGAELGKGGFGTVFAATRLQDGLRVAVKIADFKAKRYIRVDDFDQLLPAEIALHFLATKGPEVKELVQLLDWKVEADRYFMVLERPTPCVSVREFLREHEDRIEEEVIRKIMYQATIAADTCLQRGVLHRDIKPGNLLINPQTYEVKLIDFGCGELLTDGFYKEYWGTMKFSPPEFKKNGYYYGEPATVWSLGLLQFLLMLKKYPGKHDLRRMKNKDLYQYGRSEECCDFISCCLQPWPWSRHKLHVLRDHAWFKEENKEEEEK